MAKLHQTIGGYVTDFKLTSMATVPDNENMGMSVHRSSAVVTAQGMVQAFFLDTEIIVVQRPERPMVWP